jgi:hypothetical protein
MQAYPVESLTAASTCDGIFFAQKKPQGFYSNEMEGIHQKKLAPPPLGYKVD